MPSMPSRPPCQAGVGTTEALPANKDGTPDDDAHGEEFTADELTGLSLSSTRGGLHRTLCAPALPILHVNLKLRRLIQATVPRLCSCLR